MARLATEMFNVPEGREREWAQGVYQRFYDGEMVNSAEMRLAEAYMQLDADSRLDGDRGGDLEARYQWARSVWGKHLAGDPQPQQMLDEAEVVFAQKRAERRKRIEELVSPLANYTDEELGLVREWLDSR